MEQVDEATVAGLYRKYATDLAAVIEQQRVFLADHPQVTPQLDDIEAEITYLLLREYRPATVMELGTFHGWSTTWLLSALRDNGTGRLHSFDKIDIVERNVPTELSVGRWSFVRGDMRTGLSQVPTDVGHLFVDADHGRRFARWYLERLFPLMPTGIPVSVHDVFRGRRARIWSEGAEVVAWLRERDVRLFSASRSHSPATFRALNEVRGELGLTGARGPGANPMIFFSLP